MRVLVRRILTVLVAVMPVIVLIGGGAFLYFTRQSFPQTDGVLHLAGLSGEVTVIRDRFGVPQIYADTPQDLFRAEGFVHAQDRYFQMEFWRRVGQGRLAELFGASALPQDKFIRTLGWQRTAAVEAAQLSPEARDALQAYADGVNAYALANPDKLGLEFRVLGLIGRNWQPEPWKPENTLTWAKVMGWQLGENMSSQLLRGALMDKGGPSLVDALMPPYPADAPVTVPTKREIGDRQIEIRDQRLEISSTQSPISNLRSPVSNLQSLISLYQVNHDFERASGLIHTGDIGSNDWVIGGSHTTTGKPILANDPHLGVQMPSIWYQVGLHCRTVSASCPYDVVGVSFAGAPGVIIGHNNRIAWGVTNGNPAVEDLYVERPNPANPDEFEFKGKYEPARIIEEKINVAGQAAPVSLRVRITRHGPIMSDVDSAMTVTNPISVRWTGLEPGTLFDSVLQLDRAQNWQQFRDALRLWDAPSQNFVYADVDGNIGYQMPGKIPIRANGTGDMPMPGWTGEYEWTGYVPFDKLPNLYNPPEGFIATANNAPVDDQYPYFLGENWDQGYRIRRIRELIQAKDKLSVDDIKLIQGDTYSEFAPEVLPYLSTLNIPDDLLASNALAELNKWDNRMTRDSVGALIFEVFWPKLAHNIFDGALGGDLAERAIGETGGTSIRTALRTLLADPDSHWWSDAANGATKPRDTILIQTIRDTVAILKAKLGPDIKNWQYGKLHTITFENQTLGKSGIPVIESIFNRGPFPVDGAGASVDATAADASMAVVSAPSWRMIVDMGDFSKSQAIHTTGQSGHA
ncbi:MAG: penicillin acylase family protein, partial [Chloroflexi bacterium]|nr:penicillin acylase family protein [Chloroflexota bacterium]